MSKSNFSKAMKELIGINDDTENGDEIEITGENIAAPGDSFGKIGQGIEIEEDDIVFEEVAEDLKFEKDRDDAAAKLRNMLNKDKEKEPEESNLSFAEKLAKTGMGDKKTEDTQRSIKSTESKKPAVDNSFKGFKDMGLKNEVAATPSPVIQKPTDKTIKPEEARTTIGKGVILAGNLSAQGDVEINGIVKGDVKTSGNVIVIGKVAGDVATTDLDLRDKGAIQGDVLARGTANIGKDTIVIGDVTAGNIKLDGKVKGNLAARDVADLSQSSVIDGNVSAASVAINPGTKLRGQISLTSASDVNDDDFIIDFEE